MEDFIDSPSYDENDIEDFEEYLQYYGFNESVGEDDEDEDTDNEIKELYF